ncbi:MAG: hypothetical protein KF685_10635 [Acidobacteria bacterium]|nr:hypothetical protein [Acidobacteriota bacterium]
MRYVLMVLMIAVSVSFAFSQKLKAEEVIAKHIEAIGGIENFKKIEKRAAAGSVKFRSKQPAKETDGRAVIASDKNNQMFFLQLNSQEYPNEKIGYFAEKTELPFVTAGARSPLGAFLADHDSLLREGLFLGVLNGKWALINTEETGSKIRNVGGKNVDGQKTVGIEYTPKGVGSQEFSVRMYFDAKSFHHLRTVYTRQIQSSPDTFGQLGRQAGVKQTLTETYGEHRAVDGLVLPHSYTAHYVTDSNSGVYEFVWKVDIAEYRLNAEFVDNFFKF